MLALKWWLTYSTMLEGRLHLNSSPFSITLNLLLAAEASDSESVVESLFETYDKWCSFPLSPWAYFLPSFPSNFLRFWVWGCNVFFFLTFSIVWVLSSLEKVLHLLLYLQSSQLALQVSLPLYHFLSALSYYEFTTGEIGFGWCWFSCSKSLFKLFCDIAETILKLFGEFFRRIFRVTKTILRLLQELDRSLHEQSRKMEDWAPRWDERVKVGKRSFRSTKILRIVWHPHSNTAEGQNLIKVIRTRNYRN